MMTDKPKKLSDTARALLTAAALRNDHPIALPKLPMAAARQVVRSLLNAGLADEVRGPFNELGYAWRTGGDGALLHLRATSSGIAAALEDAGNDGFETAVAPAPPTPGPDTVPDAAQPPELAHGARQGAIVSNPRLGLRPGATHETLS